MQLGLKNDNLTISGAKTAYAPTTPALLTRVFT
jgi:hypothetical protein